MLSLKNNILQSLTGRNKNIITIFLLLIFFSLHRLYNLGFKEIQMWDESLYGVRAKSIYYFNDWIDQTVRAVGGLYSSSHPPLLIWLIALVYKVFGINEFATRLFPAIFGSLTVILTYLLTRKFFGGEAGLLLIPFLGSIYLFNFYSRQAQLDIPYIFFITLSIYFYLEFLNGKKSYLYFSGFAFGLALMTKIIVGFFAVITIFIFLIFMWLKKEISTKEIFHHLVPIVSIGLIISFPWHIYMLKNYGSNFIDTFFKFHIIERLSQGVEGNIPELGYFYILNQIIVQFPPAVLVFFDTLKILKNPKRVAKEKILIQAWFWSTFLITSISKTKIPTYALPSLIPAVIIASTYLGETFKEQANTISLSALLISLIWSSSQELRNGVKDFLKLNLNENAVILTALFLIAILLSPFLVKVVLKLRKENFAKFVLYFAILIGIFVILKTEFLIDYSRYDDGARVICEFIDSSKVDTLFYLYTKHSTGGMNPQLTFYSYRKISGSIKWIEIPREKPEIIKQYLSNSRNLIVLMERTAKDSSERFSEVNYLIKILGEFNFKRVVATRRYFLFVREG